MGRGRQRVVERPLEDIWEWWLAMAHGGAREDLP